MYGFKSAALAVLFGLVGLPVVAQEIIRDFDTAIVVARDASVTITETITVNAQGNAIRRGIFRDIPTVLQGPQGQEIRSELDVISVTRNGSAEPYSMQGIRNGERIRIGQEDVLLSSGTHRYQIRYTMDRAARMFEDHDEIYWNATGNFWEFPIQNATAVVTLPEGANIIDLTAFTGAQGVMSSDNSTERLSDNQARFRVTRTLQPYEGLTVAVAFEKGVLVAPSGTDAARYWLGDNLGLILPSILVLLVLGYNGLAWGAVGRDPAKGVIIPRFYPPKGFSPALVHYVHRMGWEKSGWTAFSAALVSLATKGLLDIDVKGKKTTLTATGKRPEAALPPGEKVIFEYLYMNSPVTIDTDTGPELSKRKTSFINALELENRARFFKNNAVYVFLGIGLAVASLVAMVVVGVLNPLFLFISIFASVFVLVFVLGMRSLWNGSLIGRILSFGIIGIFIVNAGGIAFDALSFAGIDYPVIAAVTIIVISLVFAVLMRAPTVHGRKLMDEIDGFKMYLDTAEKERLNFTGEPEMSVLRFESLLPYAMALGVEKPWAERFEGDLARNAIADAKPGYAPHWYHGSSFARGGFASSMSKVGAGLSAAMVAAQPASSSSSGFSGGGGGFSGGGGGGGGGGGW